MQQQTSILDILPQSLETIDRATQLQARCAQFGFDWGSLAPVAAKVEEELLEVMEEAEKADINQERVNEEIGDLLFAVINLARHVRCDPENALKNASLKFEKRFRQIEQKLMKSGKTLQESSLDEMEIVWQEVKSEEGKKTA